MCGCLGCVVTVLGEPIRAFPSVIGPHLAAFGDHLIMCWGQFLVPCGGPSVPWEMHGVFVAIDLHAFGNAVVVIGVIGVTASITRPHIPFGVPLGDPFGQDFARTATLGDAKCKYTCLKRVFDPRHWPDQRQSIWGIWDRAVNDPLNPCLTC